MQLIYQMDMTGDFDYRNLSPVDEMESVLQERQALDVLEPIRLHIHSIDKMIDTHSDRWKIQRMPKTDLAILRTAVCEICYVDTVPEAVSVNEAVRIAKKYGDERSYAFINSVLGKIIRDRSHEESDTGN